MPFTLTLDLTKCDELERDRILTQKKRTLCPKCGFILVMSYDPGCAYAKCACGFKEAVPDWDFEGLVNKITTTNDC